MRYSKSTDAYYAVIKVESLHRDPVTKDIERVVVIDRIGPYDKPGTAKGQVTVARKERGKSYIDGWVEVSTGWKRIDD